MNKISLAFYHTIISPYRVPLFEQISQNNEITTTFYFGSYTNKERKWKIKPKQKFNYTILPSIIKLPIIGTINIALLHELYKKNYDVYLGASPNFFTTQLMWLVARIQKKPFILWTVDRDFSWEYPGLSGVINKIINKITYFITRNSDLIIVPGQDSRQKMYDLKIPEEKILTAPNAIPIPPFRETYLKCRKESLRKKLDIPEKNHVFLTVTYLRKNKGIQHLLEAFKNLNERKKNTTLVIIGDGPYHNNIKDQVNQLNLHESVQLLGYIPNKALPCYYAIADTFILPSLRDYWGFVINEAMICELPVITTNDVGAREMVKENGIIIESGEPQKLYEAITKIMEKDKKEMGKHSWAIVQNYSMEHEANAFINAVKKAVTQRTE